MLGVPQLSSFGPAKREPEDPLPARNRLGPAGCHQSPRATSSAMRLAEEWVLRIAARPKDDKFEGRYPSAAFSLAAVSSMASTTGGETLAMMKKSWTKEGYSMCSDFTPAAAMRPA